MPRTEFIATAFQVPERVVTNDDLAQLMDTSDEWIVQRSGIKTRYWVSEGETGASLATQAARKALAKAGMRPGELDCIVYCTCTPDHFEPGNGVFLERELGLTDIPAIDVRNQCSGFIYGLSVADAWIRIGQYRRILLVGAEVHSRGLDRTTRGRDTAVLFGDGAGVAILGPTDDPARGVLSTHLFADGRHAEDLWVDAPGLAHDPYISESLIRQGKHRAVMDGREVFKSASVLMPQSVAVALAANGLAPADITLLVPHQANLRIIEMVQKAIGLRDDQVYTNIQKYGNTTAASRLEILLLRALGVREVALVQLRQPQPRVAVGRIHPQVVAEVLGRFGILPLRDQHVLVGIGRRGRDVAGGGQRVRQQRRGSADAAVNQRDAGQRDGDVCHDQHHEHAGRDRAFDEQLGPQRRKDEEAGGPKVEPDTHQQQAVDGIGVPHRSSPATSPPAPTGPGTRWGPRPGP